MLSMLAALTLTAAVPSLEYKIERLGSKDVLLEGSAPIELQRSSKFEHAQDGNAVSLTMMIRPTENDDRVTLELTFKESSLGAHHEWQATLVLARGVLTTSDVRWGEGGWKIRLKVS